MTQDTPALLACLAEAGVEFIVIGGVAALAHGSAVFTRDLDVMISFEPTSLQRVLSALGPLAPRFAGPTDQAVPTDASALAGFRNLYVETKLGRIDFLGSTPIGDYATLIARSEWMAIAGVEVRVVALADLIAIKHALGRPKDKLVEAELRAIQERIAAISPPGEGG